MSHVIMIFSPCHMSPSPLSPVEFKKCPFRPVNVRGLGCRKERLCSLITPSIKVVPVNVAILLHFVSIKKHKEKT